MYYLTGLLALSVLLDYIHRGEFRQARCTCRRDPNRHQKVSACVLGTHSICLSRCSIFLSFCFSFCCVFFFFFRAFCFCCFFVLGVRPFPHTSVGVLRLRGVSRCPPSNGQLTDESESHGDDDQEHHHDDDAVDVAVNEEAVAEDLHTLALVTELHRRMKTQATQKLLDDVRALKVRRRRRRAPIAALCSRTHAPHVCHVFDSFLIFVVVVVVLVVRCCFYCSRTPKTARRRLGWQRRRTTAAQWSRGRKPRSTTLKW